MRLINHSSAMLAPFSTHHIKCWRIFIKDLFVLYGGLVTLCLWLDGLLLAPFLHTFFPLFQLLVINKMHLAAEGLTYCSSFLSLDLNVNTFECKHTPCFLVLVSLALYLPRLCCWINYGPFTMLNMSRKHPSSLSYLSPTYRTTIRAKWVRLRLERE